MWISTLLRLCLSGLLSIAAYSMKDNQVTSIYINEYLLYIHTKNLLRNFTHFVLCLYKINIISLNALKASNAIFSFAYICANWMLICMIIMYLHVILFQFHRK